MVTLIETYKNILNGLERGTIDNYQDCLAELDSELAQLEEVKEEIKGGVDIFQQLIDKIRNGQFRQLVTDLHCDEQFVDNLLGDHLKNGNYLGKSFRKFVFKLILSASGRELDVEESEDDFKIWLKNLALIQEIDLYKYGDEDNNTMPNNSVFDDFVGNLHGKVEEGEKQNEYEASIEISNPTGMYSKLLTPTNNKLTCTQLVHLFHYFNWLKALRHLLNGHYKRFDLWAQEKPLIVLGSSGVENYNKSLALLAEEDCHIGNYEPFSVIKFKEYLNKALGLPKNLMTDLYSTNGKKHIFHINVCLDNTNVKHLATICTIAMINKIMQQFAQKSKQIAILDIRVTEHVYTDDLKPENLWQDRNAKSEDVNRDSRFGIRNTENYHQFARVGNPGMKHHHILDQPYVCNKLRELRQAGFPIERLYS